LWISWYEIFTFLSTPWQTLLSRLYFYTICLIWSWNICRCCRISDRFFCRFFIISSILFLITVKFCSMLSINIDALDVLIISRIDKSPKRWQHHVIYYVEYVRFNISQNMQINGAPNVMKDYAPTVRTITNCQSLLEIMTLFQ
jgi:hypothetical protein